jgi:nitrilase
MNLRAAVVQMGSFDEPGVVTVRRLLPRIAEAAAQGARLVVFPEALVGGYPKGQDFGATVGRRTPEGRAQFRRYFERAITLSSAETSSIATAAARAQVWVVVGVVERAGATLFCTVLFFSPAGELAGIHRKVMPTAAERLIWGQGDGSTLTVLDTEFGRLGAVICWENYMPLLRYAMYRKGIQLYCACTVDDRDSWLWTMRHIAVEGRCFVLSACQYVDSLIRGGSLIVNPFGELLAGPHYGEETILLADLNLDLIPEAKFDLDVTGHYARHDIFQLTVTGE